MKHPWDTSIMLCRVEDACCTLKKQLANGSMLKGYTAKDASEIDQEAVNAAFNTLKAQIDTLESYIDN